ncbi:MAG: hypothetical protein ACXVH7_10620, partial [Thermoanaerobaculia bacterium]
SSIASMSKVLDIEASSLSRDLSLLQKKGLVRLTTATDRRSRALQLTPRGQRTLVSAFDAWRRAHDKLLAVIGERDFQSMLKQTRHVGRAVKSIR